jgi:hypothetical protein
MPIAARNYDAIPAAAKAVFAQAGTDAPSRVSDLIIAYSFAAWMPPGARARRH